jgi:hypothetical protein
MPQTMHPLDLAVEEFDTARRALIRAFITTNNEIDAVERAALDVVEQAHRIVREYRLREVAADSYKRNGPSRLTRDRFHDAGAGLVDLAAKRNARHSNVIPLRANHPEAS